MKSIAVYTGNRSEYGLLISVLNAIAEHPNLEYKLIVSGSHLDEDFGQSVNEIEKDGFHIDASIKIDIANDSLNSNVIAIGSSILKIAEAIQHINPDLMLVYGDRSEALSAVIASSQMNVPTVHIEGGDLTEGGALDDSVRHAMTKLSHLHFATNKQSSNRILAMGEEAWRVHNVGLLALDMISDGNFATSNEVVEKLQINLSKPILLFTQHSVTTESKLSRGQINISLSALEKLSKMGIQIIATYPNNDAGGRKIIEELKLFNKKLLPGFQIHKSLGRYLYHGVLALAKDRSLRVASIGNSSSGIKETPMFGCPTVNIGSRQSGRLRGQNVIDVDYIEKDIIEACLLCLHDKKFRNICHKTENPYYSERSGKQIAHVLSKVKIDQKLIRKKMTLSGEVNEEGWYR